MEACVLCSNSATCHYCEAGYFLNSTNNCESCSSALNGCIFCNSSSTCLECKSDYNLINNTCVLSPSTPTTSTPTQSSCLLSFCLSCTYDNQTNTSSCTECLPTHYILNGNCESCRVSIPNCL